MDKGEFSSNLSKADTSMESFHARCAFADAEIDNAGKHALQDFFNGNPTFDEMIRAIGRPYGAEKPVLGALLRKVTKCLNKHGMINGRKLKAGSWDVSKADH